MEEIELLLSAKRLAKYQGLSKEDAFKHHLFNSEIAESFYQSLSYFEIILRNKIDLVFSKYLGNDWIFNQQYHIGKNENHFNDAIERIKREKGDSYIHNRDCVISELVFGYWSYLFSSAYKEVLWNKYPTMLDEIFENSKDAVILSKISYDINKIRLYLNKVFHYGSLLVYTDNYDKPQHIHNVVYNLLRIMGAVKLSKIIRSIDSFDAVYMKGKKLRILK